MVRSWISSFHHFSWFNMLNFLDSCWLNHPVSRIFDGNISTFPSIFEHFSGCFFLNHRFQKQLFCWFSSEMSSTFLHFSRLFLLDTAMVSAFWTVACGVGSKAQMLSQLTGQARGWLDGWMRQMVSMALLWGTPSNSWMFFLNVFFFFFTGISHMDDDWGVALFFRIMYMYVIIYICIYVCN